VLSRELMGVLCLGVVWVTALLVAAAAMQDLFDLRRIARLARGAIVGTAHGDLAEWSVEQTARAIDKGGDQAIAFHERHFAGEIFGGAVTTDGSGVFEIDPSKTGQVWLEQTARVRALSCVDVTTFDAVYGQARKAKGALRSSQVRIGDGDRVFVVGEVTGKRVQPAIVSTVDPVAFCNRKSLLIALFIPVELALCAVATRVALEPPHFGRTSIIGALLCFAFFLGVTPVAVSLREGVRRPHEAFLRVKWSRQALESSADSAHAQRLTQRKT
jgi:hypothetical protein